MPVSGIEQPALSAGASLPAGYAPQTADSVRPLSTHVHGSAAIESIWRLRMLRGGLGLLICFEIVYFLLDLPQAFTLTRIAIALHVAAVATSVMALAATGLERFERNSRLIVFAALALIFGLTLGLALLTGQMIALRITVMLGLIGSAAVMSWGTRWQGALTLAALGAVAVPTLTIASYGAHAVYNWLTFLIAAALSHVVLVVNERHRAELAQWTESMEASHQRLRESEAELRKVLEASGDAITISRLSDGRYLDFNQCFCEVTGHTRAEALGRSAAELGLWPSRDQLRELLRRLRANGQVRNMECTFRMKDGRLAQHLVSASVMELDGEACVVAASRDVSELKRTEQELRATQQALSDQVEALHRSQERLREEIAERALAQQGLQASETKLRRVFETSVDAIAISRFPDRHIIDCNPEFLAITGLTREQALSSSIVEMSFWHNRGQYREFIRQLREYGFVRGMEAEIEHCGGGVSPFLVSATLTEINGQTCVVKTARDISALKQTERDLRAAQQALSAQVGALHHSQELLRAEIIERELAQRRLADSERKFRRVFESGPDAIAIIDVATWRIVDCNSEMARVVGYRHEQIIGRTMAELDAWTSRRKLREVTELLLAMGVVRNLEVEIRHSGGTAAPYLFSAVVAEIEGRPCVLAITRDIGELKGTERELIAAREAALAASQAKSEFLSSMSHEIRTPLSAVLGMADLLWETSLNGEQRRYLRTMRANGEALLSLVNDILDLAKVESGRLSLERSEFDLVELAESVMETLGIRAHEKGLELALRIRPEVPVAAVGDPLRLRQVLINLVGNAIKFTQRGEVTLTIEAAAPQHRPFERAEGQAPEAHSANGAVSGTALFAERRLLRFAVRDTGIGIPAEKLETIFSSFTQADSTTTRKYGGSGLGLAIVKRLVELMGGQLAVESRPGLGSTFSFIAPFEFRPGAGTVRYSADERRGLAGARLLVADDSPACRAILTEMLAPGGAAVTEAGDGGAAIAEIERARAAGRPYDVVLADCAMAAPDAIAVGQHLRAASGEPPEAIVLMLTADDLPARLGRLHELGFGEGPRCRHLVKPIRRAELLAIVTAARAGAAFGDDGPAHGPAYRNGSTAGTAAANGPAEFPGARHTTNGMAAPGTQPRRILLAEDSPDNRMVIEAYLKRASYLIDHADNGEAAVRKFMAGTYDAVLMDIQMPVMDGYAAAAEIRRWERENRRSPTPIVALTASAHDEAAWRSLKMGCDAHVTKPVKRSTLLKVIDQVIQPSAEGEPAAAREAAPAAANERPAASREPNSSLAAKERAAKGPGSAGGGTEGGRIVVHLDEDLADLVPGFLARKREDAGTILAAAERGDGEAIARLGHKLKGEGGGYGLDAISNIGRALEQAAGGADFDTARRLAHDLIGFLDRLEIVYQPMEE